MDLYRLNSLDEALNIAIEDHLWSGKHCFIEWPQLILPLLQKENFKKYLSKLWKIIKEVIP